MYMTVCVCVCVTVCVTVCVCVCVTVCVPEWPWSLLSPSWHSPAPTAQRVGHTDQMPALRLCWEKQHAKQNVRAKNLGVREKKKNLERFTNLRVILAQGPC